MVRPGELVLAGDTVLDPDGKWQPMGSACFGMVKSDLWKVARRLPRRGRRVAK